jgi:membrane protein YqaA with SNARE-associated domain
MNGFFHYLLRFLFHLGYLGPFVMGIFDSSFLFLPFGNDLLIVALTARHHNLYLIYVVSAVCGSTLGVFLLDLVARRIGEEGVTRVAGERRFAMLKSKIGKYGGKALVTGSLAPPPFPFTMVVAVNSALGYPRKRLLILVALSRAVRFLILGALAIKFGRAIIHLANSAGLKYFMYCFTAICLAGSVASITTWVRKARPRKSQPPRSQPPNAQPANA